MLKLEDIKKDAQIQGLEGDKIVKIVHFDWVGTDSVTVFYVDQEGRSGIQALFRTDEERLALAKIGRPWSFDADGEAFKLGLEAYRIKLAHLFDPMMAVHSSNVEPLPHQISAVYESMLPRQPLRYVLADDPGAGKTIMAGLFIRELIMRADARRILIVSPGSLTEQWQDELFEKFGLSFEIFSREKQQQCASNNYFTEQNHLIARLDQLSRNEEFQDKLKLSEWDLIVVDEAHKMSAHYFGSKVDKTSRFRLGELLGSITRHYLLMTATPHNGKDEDFQLFMSLLDGDRFYGKFREGAHKVDVSDMMRRMVKEDLLKFDGTPLFPERRAYTANYALSPLEEALYLEVTDYVRHEMNRADKLDGKRKGNVGFALTQLQRRLASSPEAIYQSIKRRRKRLENRVEQEKIAQRGGHQVAETLGNYDVKDVPKNIDEAEDEMLAGEYEKWADDVVDQATAAQTIEELQTEILILKGLENQACKVVQSGNDKKWEQLSSLLQDTPEMFDSAGSRRKLIIFTEYKDTLTYLLDRITNVFGNQQAVITIHGGTNRDERRKNQEEFRNNPDVLVLIATDAAGEGVNLQNANLMVNYDLPWNPNRLEQRFGRIHRIGQTEVCHLWNVVANETREGEVFQRLLDKLDIERAALGGRVFDILGEAFDNISLKDLLIEAIRYGEQPKIRAKLEQAIDGALNTEHLKDILKRNALVEEHMGLEQLYAVKEEMEKAEARKLQPYFIRSFFVEAFKTLGGEMRSRESGRYEIKHVPATIRERDRVIGETRTPVLKQYERVCFEKQQIRHIGKPMASLIHSRHPLMGSVIDLILEQHQAKLRQGSVLLDPNDDSLTPSVLFIIDHSIRQGISQNNQTVTVSRQLAFVTINQQGEVNYAGYAPHLDLQTLSNDDLPLIDDILNEAWLNNNLDHLALNYATAQLVPAHYAEVKTRRERQADKILSAVNERLIKEINYWSERYIQLKNEVAAGKQPNLQPDNAKRRVDELDSRLKQRRKELEIMRNVVSSPPVIMGGALIIPNGLLQQRKGKSTFSIDAAARSRIEQIAMQAVIAIETALGNQVKDVSAQKCGWDISSQPPIINGKLQEARHIEIKGRAKGQTTITITRNEILYGLNQADKFILAIVIVDGEQYEPPYYIRNPFNKEPDSGVASVNYELNELLAKASLP